MVALLLELALVLEKLLLWLKKIKKVLGEIKDHKTVAATTFTRKATQEIRKRYRELGGEKTFLVTTNDSFVVTRSY